MRQVCWYRRKVTQAIVLYGNRPLNNMACMCWWPTTVHRPAHGRVQDAVPAGGPDGRLLGEITGLGAALLVVHIDRTAKPGEVAVSKY